MEIKNITVIGSGIMGAGIVQVAITSGYNVVMNDISEEILERSKAKIDGFLTSKVTKGKMTQEEKDDSMSRLTTCVDLKEAAKNADLVIEAATENLAIKKQIFATLSEACRPETILATNTSSIAISEISSAVKDQSKVIGMHFFNPVPVMKLLEIIPGINTDPEITKYIKEEVGPRLGKVVIISKDVAGFIVNTLMIPMINQAIYMLDKGVGTVEDIDVGAKAGLNHPMGPLELADLAGLDTVLAVLDVMYNDTKDRAYAACPLLRRMVSAGMYGRKSGKGFYDYTK